MLLNRHSLVPELSQAVMWLFFVNPRSKRESNGRTNVVYMWPWYLKRMPFTVTLELHEGEMTSNESILGQMLQANDY